MSPIWANRIRICSRVDALKAARSAADPDYAITDLRFLYQNKRADLVGYIDSLH
jgi:hypothetical protein